MPVSFRNIINGGELSNAITSGDFSNVLKKPNATNVKYIRGYAQDTAIEALANGLNINKGLFQQVFGIEKKETDLYDPYHTSDAKKEEFWFYNETQEKRDGKEVQSYFDESTNSFKRGLYEEYGFRQSEFWYEDPLIPSFELYFDEDSPLFSGDDNIQNNNTSSNSLKGFIQKYQEIDPINYSARFDMLNEFKNVFFKIFNSVLDANYTIRQKKQYYITKITGLNNLNKKMINYGEDKITITLNEDVSMISWYLSELYNNLIYSYKNQRYMFPDNVLRFNLILKINDIRNFQLPQNNNPNAVNNTVNNNILTNGSIKNVISPKSEIIYQLHDCSFNFFESRNYEDEMSIGGYGESMPNTPSKISFDIIFKSVTRSSNFPLIQNSISITPWEDTLITRNTIEKDRGTFESLSKMKNKIKEQSPSKKRYLNNLLSNAGQTVANFGLNYVDNLESSLRSARGNAVNGLLLQFRQNIGFNKIEPDNVYLQDFNNRTSLKNFGNQLASGLLNGLEDTVRQGMNF